MSKRIAFIGVSSTGKSTLSRQIAQLLGYPYVVEQVHEARSLAEQDTHRLAWPPKDFTVSDKIVFERYMIKAQRQAESNEGDRFVSDSAQLVQLMYLMYYCAPHMTEREIKVLYDECIAHTVYGYDFIFYLPFGAIPVEDDGFRLTNRYELMAMDAILRQLMGSARKRGARVYTVGAKEKHERIGEVLRHIGYDVIGDETVYVNCKIETLPNARLMSITKLPDGDTA